MEISEQELINGISDGDLTSFEDLYKKYYVYLCLVAEHIIRNHSDSEEVVSDVFIRLWNVRQDLDIHISIKRYLIKAVHNNALNYLEKNKTSYKLTDIISESDNKLLAWSSDYPLGQLYQKEIIDILEQGVCKLPDCCREIFMLSRDKELDYNSVKTPKMVIQYSNLPMEQYLEKIHLALNRPDILAP